MPQFDLQFYGAACSELLQGDRLCELGPGAANREARPMLADLDQAALFPGRPVVDRDMAECCRAGLWLWHDFLDESHTISQSVKTSSGSYWHGIMHRREPDYSNAKYWYRQAGRHPVFDSLGPQCQHLAAASEQDLDRKSRQLADQENWDPFLFVDLCEAVAHGRGQPERFCRLVAQAEWRLLFDFCYRRAIGEH